MPLTEEEIAQARDILIDRGELVRYDADVATVAAALQKCKREGRASGHVMVHFTPQGVINLDQLCWHEKPYKKIHLTRQTA